VKKRKRFGRSPLYLAVRSFNFTRKSFVHFVREFLWTHPAIDLKLLGPLLLVGRDLLGSLRLRAIQMYHLPSK
jgi:hypothetical protein